MKIRISVLNWHGRGLTSKKLLLSWAPITRDTVTEREFYTLHFLIRKSKVIFSILVHINYVEKFLLREMIE